MFSLLTHFVTIQPCCHFLGQAVSPSQRFPGIRSHFHYLVPARLDTGPVNYVSTGLCLGFPLTVKTNTQGKGPTFPESSPLNEQISKTKTESVPRRYWAWGLPRTHLCFLTLAIESWDRQWFLTPAVPWNPASNLGTFLPWPSLRPANWGFCRGAAPGGFALVSQSNTKKTILRTMG